MRKKNIDTLELELEEYDEPFDQNFYSIDTDEEEDVIEVDDESSYDEFNTVQEIDWEQEEAELEEEEEEVKHIENTKKSYSSEDSLFYRVFPTVSSWFGIIGVILAVIIMIYFILHGSVKSLLLFMLMLVASYGLGYVCMFFIMQFIEIK